MTLISKLTSQCLKVAGIGLASLFLALPITAQNAGEQSITEIASSDDSFDTLVSLLEHAGWLESFDGSNGKVFTVFAPTDEAFDQLPEGTVDSLFKPENKEMLYDVLAYHVIGGSITSDQLSSGTVDSKANKLPLQVDVGQQITVNDATVSTADIIATNGVIHTIDMVLIPQR